MDVLQACNAQRCRIVEDPGAAWTLVRLSLLYKMDDDEATSSSLIAYYDLLRDNRAFTVVWLGEVCPAALCGAALLEIA